MNPESADKPLSFGAHILPRDYLASWDAQEQRNREMLSHALNLRDTIVFVGAGCSIALGYPSWKDLSTGKAITTAQETIKASGQDDLKSKCESRLKELQERIKPSANLRSADLTSILGTCEKVCKQCGCASDFRRRIAELFKHREGTKPNPNPYELLANLPVHRFVTSNYDCELEAALVKKRRLREEDYLRHSGKQSFAQTAMYDEQLAIFSIAFAAGYEPRVFHCHGWHCDTDSMVLTEDDYQEWYFRDQAIHGRYRQTIDLIFNSNPMLFVGFSLSDDDLLTPLRFLSALDGEKKHSRPLFALLQRSKDNNESRFEQLYDRYGIHVLSYDSEDETESDRTNALCREMREIVDRCRTHRKEWLERPRKRSIELPPSKGCHDAPAFLHYDFFDSKKPPPADEKQDSCWLTLGRTTPLVWIVGSGGMGMSWEAIQQLKKLRTSKTKPGFSGFFFWNFRYCNDAISGIQCALRFMRGPDSTEPPLDLLDELVDQLRKRRKRRYFVVLDGIERFLHRNVNKGTVVALDSSYGRFFTALADTTKPLNSVLVLTSCVLPSVFETFAKYQQEDTAATAITIKQAQGFSFDQIKSMLPDKNTNADEVEKCLGWFGEHRYGVTLAAEWLKKHDFAELEYEMAEADPEVRVPKMIGLSLKDVREAEPPAGEYAYQLLERLAVFVEPVDKKVACIGLDPTHQPHFNKTISLLKRKKLLFEVRLFNDRICYVVHPSAREYIFYHEHHSSPADLPSFALSGFTSAAATVYPGDRQSAGKKTVVCLLESLKKQRSRADRDNNEQVELCRAAFGVVRSRMVATTVSRWSRYDEYLRFLVEVIDSVRYLSKIQSPALYEDELAWLYNEAGLAYYGEGSMLDAIAVWEQSYEINRGLDQGGDGHHIFQSLCNLGGAYIQFGKLQRAESYLYKAREMGRKLGDDDHVASRIDVYLALLCHFRGNIGEAKNRYKKVIEEDLSDIGNMRAYSIALRHYADLLLKEESTRSQAWEKIQTSKAIAETHSYQDLVAYTRLSYGHLHRIEKKFPEAIREYRVALDLARKMGLRRLEAEAQSELARVDLDLGDSQVARRRAMEALQIANEHLLGLRQTHCLVILGRATINAGERELGVHYLRHAKRLADAQEYRLRANEAEAALYEIGEPVENSEVEASSAA